MAFQFTCPNCNAKFTVDESYRGRAGSCAECGKPIVMPGRASAESQAAAEAADAQRLAAARRYRSRAMLLTRAASAAAAISLLVLLGLAFQQWIAPAMRLAQARRAVVASSVNLKRIADALDAYAAEYGSYPPPAVLDEAGTPILSWRVLILPQLGRDDLYRKFRLDEDFNSPHNLELQNLMPDQFRGEGQPGGASAIDTPFTLITGEGTLFPAAGPLKPSDVTDNPKTTILLTEGNRTVNLWTAPEDLTLRRSTSVSGEANLGVGGGRPFVAAAISVAGNPLYLPNNLSAQELRGLITPRGGEFSRAPANAWFDIDKAFEMATGR